MDFNSYSRLIPNVSFGSKELELYMYNFMKENLESANGVNGYLGLVMIRLGFNVDDKILLTNFNNDDKEDYFNCIVNNSKNYLIKFENIGNRKKHNKITLIDYNKLITFECFPLALSELGVRIIPVLERIEYADSVIYTREYSRENAKYKVSYLNNSFELDVVRPKDVDLPMYDEFGRYSRYRVDNEDILVEYLNEYFTLFSGMDIINIYKKICEVSLGNDLGKYGLVSFKFLDDDRITDLIQLKNGNLERFGITLPKMGRTLFINEDGSYSYGSINNDDLFSYTMNVNNDKVIYNISMNNNVDTSLVNEIIKRDSNEVREEIDNVKKLVRKIFNNNRDSE